MKVAVVGAGYWGPNLIRNISAQGAVDGVLVCDKDAAKLDKIKSRFPYVEVTTSFDDVLSDASIEAVLLATPISTHGKMGVQVLDAKKHLFVEKPLAGSADEALQLIEAAKKNDRTLMVGHTFEYSPPVLQIGEYIDKGELGKIYFISMERVNLGLHQRDVSVIWDLAPHDFSILFRWLGEEPIEVSTVGRDCIQAGIPDVAFVNLKFPSGVIANVELAWLAPSKLRRTEVVGEKKMLVYDDTANNEKVKLYDQGVNYRDPETFGEFQLSYRTGDIVSPRLGTYEPLNKEMAHFVDCVKTGKTPETDGASGLRVVRTLEAAERSLAEGRPVRLDGSARD